MICEFGDGVFKVEWLDYIKNDPVHPEVLVKNRVNSGRTLLAYLENDEPQFIISAKISNKLCRSMIDIFDSNSGDGPKVYAIFYSVFRIGKAKGAGGFAIKEAIEFCRNKGVANFFTLSPIPFLRNNFKELPIEEVIVEYLESKIDPVSRFHINNGALVGFVNFEADKSDVRLGESWGTMVNYYYPTE